VATQIAHRRGSKGGGVAYLGMDVGTSGVKAVNEAAAIVATATCELALSHPAPLWSEQDPDAWVDAAIRAVEIVHTASTSSPRRMWPSY
jgi:sugar (pentulose or hexulose) kinase